MLLVGWLVDRFDGIVVLSIGIVIFVVGLVVMVFFGV